MADAPGLQWLADDSLHLAGVVPLALVAGDARVRERIPMLAEACARPDRMDTDARTIGEDLAQRGRCPYLQRGDRCLKNGGTTCLAVEGDNRALAILEGGPSWLLHPSDAAVALVALDARIGIAGPAGAREVDAASFFVLPTVRLDAEHVLAHGEAVTAVRIPAAAVGGVQRFDALRDDVTGEVLVSLAAARRADGEVRLVLGSVSPRPYRVYNSIEEETTSGGLDEDTIEGLAERALLDAAPLSGNGYKVEIASRLLRDAIRALSAE